MLTTPAGVPNAAAAPPGPFRAAAVLRDAARVVVRNAHVLLPLAFVLGLPAAAARLAWPAAGTEARWARVAADVLFGPVQAVGVASAVISASAGGRGMLSAIGSAGLRAVGWALCAAVIPVVLVSVPLGNPALAFPWVLVYLALQTVLFVAVPVALVERAGPRCFVRSRSLTEGHLGSILAVIVAAAFVVAVPAALLVTFRVLPPTTVAGALAFAAQSALGSVIDASTRVAAYRLLRPPDDGRELAAVFE